MVDSDFNLSYFRLLNYVIGNSIDLKKHKKSPRRRFFDRISMR